MLARDSAGRREITELARRDVAERFSIDRLVVDIDKLYRAAVLEKRAGHSTTSNMKLEGIATAVGDIDEAIRDLRKSRIDAVIKKFS